MKVFLDTNVLLDVLLTREPWVSAADTVWQLSKKHEIEGQVSVLSCTTVHYLVRRLSGRAKADQAILMIRQSFTIVLCDASVIDQALAAGMPDFEDAVQYFSARLAGAQVILTRDASGYPGTALPIRTPAQFLAERVS